MNMFLLLDYWGVFTLIDTSIFITTSLSAYFKPSLSHYYSTYYFTRALDDILRSTRLRADDPNMFVDLYVEQDSERVEVNEEDEKIDPKFNFEEPITIRDFDQINIESIIPAVEIKWFKGDIMPRHQDIDPTYFKSLSTKTIAISHRWRDKAHPDKLGRTLAFMRFLSNKLKTDSFFIDYMCLPQKPRTISQQSHYKRCLNQMSVVYTKCLVAPLIEVDYVDRAWCNFEYMLGNYNRRLLYTCESLPEIGDPYAAEIMRDRLLQTRATNKRDIIDLIDQCNV